MESVKSCPYNCGFLTVSEDELSDHLFAHEDDTLTEIKA